MTEEAANEPLIQHEEEPVQDPMKAHVMASRGDTLRSRAVNARKVGEDSSALDNAAQGVEESAGREYELGKQGSEK